MVPSPLLLDRTALTKLRRPVLQQIAVVCCVPLLYRIGSSKFHQRERIKANAKNAEIIRLLLQKHPDGVPRYVASTLCDFAESPNSIAVRRRSLYPRLGNQ